jgi:hypothetical protein
MHLSSLIMLSWLVSAAATPQHTMEDTPRADAGSNFLSQVRIVESRPDDGEVELVDREGKRYLLREGDVLEEAGGARVKDVGRSTLVLTRAVEGADGSPGECLVVVRFDASGKTRIREYHARPDVSLSEPRPPADR